MLEEKVQQLEQARSGLKMKLSGSGDEDDRKKMEIERLQRKVLILSRVNPIHTYHVSAVIRLLLSRL